MCFNQSVAAAPLFDYGCDTAEQGCICEPPFRARAAACKTTYMTGSDLAG